VTNVQKISLSNDDFNGGKFAMTTYKVLELKVGQKVSTVYGNKVEVLSVNEDTSWRKYYGLPIPSVRCKTSDGWILELYPHELV